MNGTSAWLADRVASLLPNTTAGACVPRSPWSWVSHSSSFDGLHCSYIHQCHHSCHGAPVCASYSRCHGGH